MHRNKFLFYKTKRSTNYPNLFCQETLHVSGNSTAHHQEFIHCTLSNGMCHTGLMTYTSAICTVEDSWWWAEELPETVEFLDKINLGN